MRCGIDSDFFISAGQFRRKHVFEKKYTWSDFPFNPFPWQQMFVLSRSISILCVPYSLFSLLNNILHGC